MKNPITFRLVVAAFVIFGSTIFTIYSIKDSFNGHLGQFKSHTQNYFNDRSIASDPFGLDLTTLGVGTARAYHSEVYSERGEVIPQIRKEVRFADEQIKRSNPNHFGLVTDAEKEVITLEVNRERTYQTIEGFGGALTEACSMNLLRLSEPERNLLMRKIFLKRFGAGFDVLRLPIGAPDFADGKRGSYTYDDSPGNKLDQEFKHYSSTRDEKSFDLIKKAKILNPDLRVIISPWSAPAWMKKSKKLNGGKLDPARRQDFANYLAKVIKDLRARNLPIDAMTIQNEPGHQTPNYPSMEMSTEEQIVFIRDHLYPTLKKQNIKIRILALDHNYDMFPDVNRILDELVPRGMIDGVAYHCYVGNSPDMRGSIEKHPNVPTIQTECSGTLDSWKPIDFHYWLENQSLDAINMGTTGSLGWNLCLDHKGGPQNGGCSYCRGMVTTDFSKPEKPAIIFNPEFHALAQISRFVESGSKRIHISGEIPDLSATAFLTKDNRIVFVGRSRTNEVVKFRIKEAGSSKTLSYELPPRHVVTLEWMAK